MRRNDKEDEPVRLVPDRPRQVESPDETLKDLYETLVEACINLRRVASDPVISLRERERVFAKADGVNLAISYVVKMLRASQGEIYSLDRRRQPS